MDPFSVSTACVGLLAAVARLSQQIAQFVSGVREAHRDMDSVSRELSSLALCLETLRDDSTTIHYPDGLRQTLVAVLGNCDTVTQQMHTLLEKMSSKNLGRRAQWVATGRDDMNRLRSSLEAYKSALDIALEVTAISIISAVKDDVNDVKADTTAIKEDTNQIPNIKHDTSSLIQEIAFLRLQVTELQQHDTGGGVLLKRFLQESTTYAETVIENLDEEEEYVGPRSSKQDLDRAITHPPRKGPDETYATVAKSEHSDPVMPIEERGTFLEDISDGREEDTSDLGQSTEDNRPTANIADIYGPGIVDHEASRRQFGVDQQTTRQIRRRSLNRKAMESAAAARKTLSPREKKLLDDRLAILIRGKKTLLSRVMRDDVWYGDDEAGGVEEIRSVLDAGGLISGGDNTLENLQEALSSELHHFRRLDVVKLLLSYGALDNCTLRLDYIGIWELSHSLLQLLREYWEDPNIPNGVSGTALYQCAAMGVTGHVALLLEHGANPSVMNAHSTAILRCWPRNGSSLRYPNHGSPLNIACYNGDLDTVKVLLEGGAEVSSPADGPFYTPAQCLTIGARAAANYGKRATKYENIKKILESAGANEND